MNYNYLYVFDYSVSAIYEIELDEIDKMSLDDNDFDVEAVLNNYNLNIDNCQYMYTENKVEIESIKKL